MAGKHFRRGLLIALAVSAFPVGAWAYFAPRSWYDQFPGFGMTWLPPLGPYNEHFCTDVGAAYLALTLLAVTAAIYVDNGVVVKVAALAWLTFNVLHWTYHLRMLHMYGARDAALTITSLTVVALVSAALLIPARADRKV